MITYRKPTLLEADEIASIHLKTFENFFLTSLGKSFLKTYYKSCIKLEGAISICAVDEENTVVGFCFGSLSSVGFHKKLILNNILAFTIQFISVLFSKPRAIIRLVKNLKKEGHPEDHGDYAELLSIGVLLEKKGLGIGRGLLLDFEKNIKDKKIKRISLTTDYDSNNAVLKFYDSMGYNVYYEFVTYPNRKMFKLIKNI